MACKLPSDQKCKRHGKQYMKKAGLYKEKRCKHHGIVPIINPAGAAAFIFEKPGLEGTEKQDTYDIANGISAANKQHYSIIKNA